MRRSRLMAALTLVTGAALWLFAAGGRPFAPAVVSAASGSAPMAGVRDPAWAPDGRRIAVSYLDRLWTAAPDGREARLATGQAGGVERDPAWSHDGRLIAFASNRGDGFDLYIVPAAGGAPERVTAMPGDERWPSWSPDGGIVFAHRDAGSSHADGEPDPGNQWDLYRVEPIHANGGAVSWGAPQPLTATPDNETHPRVSPDGRRVAFVSDRANDDNLNHLWMAPLPGAAATPVPADFKPVRITRTTGGIDEYPDWSPSGDRLVYYAETGGAGGVWVSTVDPLPAGGEPVDRVPHDRPATPAVLVSRHGGVPVWSPDGRTILIGELPPPQPEYNGNPERVTETAPPLFALNGAFTLWTVPAPVPVDAGTREVSLAATAGPAPYGLEFDRVWDTLRKLYYASGPSATAWQELKDKYRPEALAARDADAFEDVVDRMVEQQPLIKPAVVSSKAIVVSGNPLASEAGRIALQKGGNVVDAMIAVSFALGVVEPDATSVGGDGQAILYLKGMKAPTVVEYKDETPIHATLDNPKIFRHGHLVADGAAAPNIPGTVAGLEYLYKHYGSGKVSWADLIAPAIHYAEDGFILDDALPTTIAVGRQYIEKSAAAKALFMPGGKIPRPGDRFYNKDYANTLREIAKDGAYAFYHGKIAHEIAADLQAHGGIIGLDDLAQYRAIERTPLEGDYRGYKVFGPPPPVSDGDRMIETLQILGNYTPKPGATFWTDPDLFHYMIESWKVRDNDPVGDPAHWPIEFGDHLTLAHAAALFAQIDPQRASRFHDEPPERPQPGAPTHIGHGTTAFVVADAEGNMIASTQTLSTWGGNFYVSKGLGFLYNDHLRSNRTTPGVYGQLLPLTRSTTTNSPTLLLRDDHGHLVPRLAVACAGNAWITSSVYSIIVDVIDSHLSMQRAIEAPRFLIGRDPSDPAGTAERVQIEDRIPRTTLATLMARGHRFQKIGRKGEVRYGYAAGALVDVAAHRVEAGAEPRRSHGAVAEEPSARSGGGRRR
ncbi:MAG TPA: LpqB family beta-propeller domain-containing protein [Vicinamibacterales bacterium]|nr:LpqB family beta-propeller domain-containing protein [Vicinamibacterales bacterium]